MKKKNQTEPAAVAASIDILEQDIAKRTEQRTDAETALGAARDAGQAAQQRRDDLRLAALADAEPGARDAYLAATVDYRSHADDVLERAALIEQLDAELARLNRDLHAAKQAAARAKADTLTDKSIATLKDAEPHLVALVEKLEAVEANHAEQYRIRAAAGLPEAANIKFQLNDHLGHVLTWRLYPRVGRPRHHIYQKMTLAEAEAARQGRTPIVEPIDEDQTAVLREVIDTTLAATADTPTPEHTEH